VDGDLFFRYFEPTLNLHYSTEPPCSAPLFSQSLLRTGRLPLAKLVHHVYPFNSTVVSQDPKCIDHKLWCSKVGWKQWNTLFQLTKTDSAHAAWQWTFWGIFLKLLCSIRPRSLKETCSPFYWLPTYYRHPSPKLQRSNTIEIQSQAKLTNPSFQWSKLKFRQTQVCQPKFEQSFLLVPNRSRVKLLNQTCTSIIALHVCYSDH
jgi:hypothetical protein